MRVAHLAVVTPGRCGLYETTRELVANLRARGVDSRIVDPKHDTNDLHPGGEEDRGALFADLGWALDADVLVSHSGLGEQLEATDQPVVHVAHGRPRSSFLHELAGTRIYSHLYNRNLEERCRAVVSFWPEHEPYLRVMFPDTPVHTVQASVDLVAWHPAGPKHDFGGKRGRINVVCADMWRDDIDPFVPINAFALWARRIPDAKLHLYGVSNQQGIAPLLRVLQDSGSLGEVRGFTRGLAHVYRAASCLITPHLIDTRSVREAMACGCPVVRIPGPVLNGFRGKIWDGLASDRYEVRREAERRFEPRVTAEQFHTVLEGVA